MENLSQSTTSFTTENTLKAAFFSIQCTPDKCPVLRLLIEENQRLANRLDQLTGTKNLYSHMLFDRSSEKTPETEQVARFESAYDEIIKRIGRQPLPLPEEKKRGKIKKSKTRNLLERLDQNRAAVLLFMHDFRVSYTKEYVSYCTSSV